MLQGVLVTNAFLRTDKFVEHYEWLKEAAEQYHIALSLLENTDLLCMLPGEGEAFVPKELEKIVSQVDFVLFWDKDVPYGKILQEVCAKKHIPMFNSIESIAACDNKMETYRILWEWNRKQKDAERIPLIPTIAAPMTYANIGYTKLDFLEQVIRQLGFPMIIKESFGSFGMQVYIAKDREELEKYTKRLGGKPFLYQKMIQKSVGKDVRIQVVGDQVAASMYRYSEHGDFRANITNGGSMKCYTPSKEECELAVRTTKALGLDFAGVDLLFQDGMEKGANVVCEVNSNAHFKNIFQCTHVNVADCIMRYIKEVLTGTVAASCSFRK